MPRNVRPAWLDIDTDGRSTTIGTGPAARTGKLRAVLSLRSEGAPLRFLDIEAGGFRDGEEARMILTLSRPARVTTTDGKTYTVPAGTTIEADTPQ